MIQRFQTHELVFWQYWVLDISVNDEVLGIVGRKRLRLDKSEFWGTNCSTSFPTVRSASFRVNDKPGNAARAKRLSYTVGSNHNLAGDHG
jgi:hypothetical protein